MNERNTAAAALEWDGWLDSLQHALRKGVHGYLRKLLDAEIAEVLGRIDTRDATARLNQRGAYSRAVQRFIQSSTVSCQRMPIPSVQ